MFNKFILPLVKPFIIWRNPNMAVTNKDNRWTPRQLYQDAKGERAQHKILQMAVKKLYAKGEPAQHNVLQMAVRELQ
jgi:hypothetical protein